MNEDRIRFILLRLQEIKDAQFILSDQIQSMASQTQEKLARIELELNLILAGHEDKSDAV